MLLLQFGCPWRAPRHRSALRWAALQRMKNLGFTISVLVICTSLLLVLPSCARRGGAPPVAYDATKCEGVGPRKMTFLKMGQSHTSHFAFRVQFRGHPSRSASPRLPFTLSRRQRTWTLCVSRWDQNRDLFKSTLHLASKLPWMSLSLNRPIGSLGIQRSGWFA